MALREPATFAELLRAWRRASGLTQEVLAERARISTRAISDLERGAKRHPYRDTVRRIAEALALGDEQRVVLETAARGAQPARPSSEHQPAEPELVGRAAEMERLQQHLASDGPPVLFLTGEPGIGKSRLLREIAAVAEEHGLAVWRGGCTRRSRHEPFAPLADAVGSYLAALPVSRQRELLKGAGWLVRLLPELGDDIDIPLPVSSAANDGERRLLFAAVNRVLARAGVAGTVLLLDDLQWAGRDALDLLAFVTEGAAETGVRVVAAYRSTEVRMDDDLFVLRSDLGARYLAAEMEIAPLGPSESAALLWEIARENVSPELEKHILQRSSGVPFYLCSYAYSMASGGEDTPVPWTAAQSVRQRVAALTPQTREVLAAAALVGRAVPIWLLGPIVDLEERPLVEAIEAACLAGLIDERDTHHYTFAHDVIRDVVEADVSAARRRMLHRRIAEALETLPALERQRNAAQLAWHLERAGEPQRAADYALLAGDVASQALAHSEAAAHYRSVAVLSAGHDLAKQAEALYRLGGSLLLQGHPDEAAAALEQTADLRRQLGDLEGEALAVAQFGWMQFFRGDVTGVLPRIRGLVAALEPHGPSRGLCALDLLLTLLLWGVDAPAGLEAAERASTMARALGDDGLLVQAEVRRGLALGGIGRWADGAAVLEGIVPLAEQIGDLTRLAEGFSFAGIAYDDIGNLPRALELHQRAVQWAEQLGSPGHQAYALHALALVLFEMGQWSEARTHLTRAAELDRLRRMPSFSYTYAITQARLAAAEGRDEDVERHLEEARAVAPQDTQQMVAVHAACLQAERKLLSGNPTAARAVLAPYLADLRARPGAVTHTTAAVTEILLECGEVDEAERMLGASECTARRRELKVVLADVQRVRGMLLAQFGRDGADEVFGEALATAQSLPHPQLEGRILRAWGQFTADGAVRQERLRRALKIFEELGAEPDARRTRRFLGDVSTPQT